MRVSNSNVIVFRRKERIEKLLSADDRSRGNVFRSTYFLLTLSREKSFHPFPRKTRLFLIRWNPLAIINLEERNRSTRIPRNRSCFNAQVGSIRCQEI